MKMTMCLLECGQWYARVEENDIAGKAMNLDKDTALSDAILAQIETKRAFSSFNKFTDRFFITHETAVYGNYEEVENETV